MLTYICYLNPILKYLFCNVCMNGHDDSVNGIYIKDLSGGKKNTYGGLNKNITYASCQLQMHWSTSPGQLYFTWLCFKCYAFWGSIRENSVGQRKLSRICGDKGNLVIQICHQILTNESLLYAYSFTIMTVFLIQYGCSW